MSKSIEIDKANIPEVIKQFFGTFCNKNRSKHGWDLIFRISIPETIIIKKNGFGQTIYNLRDFIEPWKTMLTDGTLTDFEETEIDQQTIIIHNIAQRQSRYQKAVI